MKPKKIISTILLVFVAVSIVALVNKEMQAPEDSRAAEVDVVQFIQDDAGELDNITISDSNSERVVAYYFHGNMRCASCRTLEKLAHDALNSGFDDELNSGRLVFQEINVESPGNRHYIHDFQLTNRSIVIALYRADGELESWKNLEQVWQLLRDSDGFILYVQSETQALLEGLSG